MARPSNPDFGSGDPKTPKTQRERFIETARAIGCNEDEDAFKAKLAVIARQKPKPGN